MRASLVLISICAFAPPLLVRSSLYSIFAPGFIEERGMHTPSIQQQHTNEYTDDNMNGGGGYSNEYEVYKKEAPKKSYPTLQVYDNHLDFDEFDIDQYGRAEPHSVEESESSSSSSSSEMYSSEESNDMAEKKQKDSYYAFNEIYSHVPLLPKIKTDDLYGSEDIAEHMNPMEYDNYESGVYDGKKLENYELMKNGGNENSYGQQQQQEMYDKQHENGNNAAGNFYGGHQNGKYESQHYDNGNSYSQYTMGGYERQRRPGGKYHPGSGAYGEQKYEKPSYKQQPSSYIGTKDVLYGGRQRI